MSDSNNPNDVPANYGSSSEPSGPPAYSGGTDAGAAGYAPPASQSKVLSIISLIAGILSIVIFLLSWVAMIVGAGAIVLAIFGRRRESSRGLALGGLITGIIGFVLGLVVLIFALAVIGHASH